MCRKIFFTFFILSSIFRGQFSYSQLASFTLSDSAKISLLTCSPGEELYSIFGHSAIRVTDHKVGVDWVFNYGTFDFSDPDFYPNFVKGRLNYILSVAKYHNFEYTYIHEGRYIFEQLLNLEQKEKQHLFDSLLINYLPENRYYLYDFLFDNCATRIRDIIVEAVPREIQFGYQSLEQNKTYRELLMPYVLEKPWAKLGINLLLGTTADRKASCWDYMFLPDHMMTAFLHAKIKADNEFVTFNSNFHTLLEGKEVSKNRLKNFPLFTFSLFLILSIWISYYNITTGSQSRWFDAIVFGLVGFLGFVIAFQWFGSDHVVMAWNLNILWTHPLHLIAIFMLFSKKCASFTKIYFLLNFFLLSFVLLAWPFLPQVLPIPVYPLVLALAIRTFVINKTIWLSLIRIKFNH
jgi:hypothetical protein